MSVLYVPLTRILQAPTFISWLKEKFRFSGPSLALYTAEVMQPLVRRMLQAVSVIYVFMHGMPSILRVVDSLKQMHPQVSHCRYSTTQSGFSASGSTKILVKAPRMLVVEHTEEKVMSPEESCCFSKCQPTVRYRSFVFFSNFPRVPVTQTIGYQVIYFNIS